MRPKTITVADYLTKAIDLSGLTHREVAGAVGYPKPNIISMMQFGQTKVPLEKVPVLARALGVDPAQLTRIAMRRVCARGLESAGLRMSSVRPSPSGEKKLLELLREVEPGVNATSMRSDLPGSAEHHP